MHSFLEESIFHFYFIKETDLNKAINRSILVQNKLLIVHLIEKS